MKKLLLILLFAIIGLKSYAQADMVVTNTNYQTAFIPGYPSVYTVTVTNSGPNDAADVTVTNPIPVGITQFSWTGDNGSSGTDIPLNDLIAIFNNGETVTYTITLFVPPGYTGTLVSQATVAGPTPDPDLTNNSLADTDIAPTPGSADIVVFKTDNDLTYTAGQTQTYTIILANHGPAAATNVTIQDLVPAGIVAANVSWTGDNGSSGTGDLNDAIANFAVGDTIIYTVTMPVPADFDQNTNLVNTVTTTSATPDDNPLCQGCTDIDTPEAKADIVVLKTNGQTQYLVGEATTYTIIVHNNGPSDAVNVTVTDNMPVGISDMTWSSDQGPSGTGNMVDIIPTLAVGQSVTYTVTIDIPIGYNIGFVTLTNVVSVTSDTTDPNPACPGCIDTDTPRPRWVTVDTGTYTVPQLIEDVLIDSDCADVSNFTTQIGSSSNPGVGYFHRNNSNFPLKSGVVIRSGSAAACAGPFTDSNVSTTGSGQPDDNSIGYNADPQDLHGVSVANGNPGSINDVAYVQFDFTPLTDNFSFEFLFASNEYGTFQCNFGDVFAFILKNQVTGVVSNLAVIPSTTTPVSVTSIRDTAYNGTCGSVNPGFFGVFNEGNPANAAIDMRGQTIPMTASATVVPNNLYSIKLVIGDYQDSLYDSAVFIEAGSFNVGQADLGRDMLVAAGTAGCAGSSMVLDTELDPAQYTFTWTHDGAVMSETTSSITVTEEGEYCVVAATGTCTQQDCIVVEFRDVVIPPAQAPTEAISCSGLFDLTQVQPGMFGSLNPNNYQIGYYHSEFHAQNEINEILPNTAYPGTAGEIVYVKVLEVNSGFDCYVIFPFVLNTCDVPDLVRCDDSATTDAGFAPFDLTPQIAEVLGADDPADYTITFHTSQSDADNDVNPIVGIASYTNTSNPQTIYIRKENNSNPTLFSTDEFDLIVYTMPATPVPADVTVCSDVGYALPALPAGSTYHSASGGSISTQIAAGTLYNTANTTTTVFVYAQSGTMPNCTAEGDFTITVVETPTEPDPADVTVCSVDGYQLPILPPGQTYHSASGGSAATEIPAGTIYNTPSVTTVYVFAQAGTAPNTCTAEADFVITVNESPVAIDPADVSVCSDTGYVLPALPAGSTYHDASNGGGNQLAEGTTIDTAGAHLIYVFSQTATTPNCTAEGSFTVTVTEMPTSINPADVTVCSANGYLLPTLPLGSTYHTATGGLPATEIAAGTNINTVGTNVIYIYSQTATTPNCWAEGSFTVTVNQSQTAINPADVTVCSDAGYLLPALPAGSTYHSASGGSAATVIPAGTTINTIGMNTIYVFSQSGTTPNCTAEGSFIVTVNETPQAINPANVAVCDTDGYILPSLPAGSTYHSTSGGSAATEIAAGTNINTIGNNLIYIFSQSGTTPNCIAEGSFTIIVSPAPTAINPSDVTVCDSYVLPALPSGSTYHSASGGSAATGIAAGTAITALGATTIYVYSQTGTTPNCSAEGDFTVTVNATPVAEAPANVTACDSYTLPFLNVGSYFSGPNGTGTAYQGGDVITADMTMYVYAQTGTTPNCSDQNSFTIDIFQSPVATQPSPIWVCDDNNDGFSCLFDLSSRDVQVSGGVAGLVVSYHETLTDAQTGANAIPAVGGYCNIVAHDQTLYVRLFDPAAPLCYATTTLDLHVDPVPVPNAVIPDYELCDTTAPVGEEVFELALWEANITGQSGLSVSYHLSQGDAQGGISPLAGFYTNISNPQQIWARLENASGCFAVSPFNLVVNPLPLAYPATMNACGTSTGIASFNLTQNDLTVSGGVLGLGVIYYESLADIAANNPIPAPAAYQNIANPQTLYAVVANNQTLCSATTTVTLTVSQGPPANAAPAMLQVCDPNNDDFAAFDLTQAIADITGSNPAPAGVTVTFHETLTDAQTGGTFITSVGSYTNIVPSDQTIYVAVSYDATGCRTVVELSLHVNRTPQATEIPALQVCDDDTDGIGTFDLNAAIPAILGDLDPAQHTVSFHLTQADAQNQAAAITNVLGFHNTSANAQTIWVVVKDNSTGCFDVISLDLVVDPKPVLPPTATGAAVPYTKCDYNNPGDEREEFDLSSQIPGILNGQTGISVAFYLTQGDAQGQVGALPDLYINQSNAQTLWVRMENTLTGCFVLTTMDLRVEPLPVLIPPGPVTRCDEDADGFAQFDLQSLTANMAQGAPNITVTFHETLTNAQNDVLALASPYLNIVAFQQPLYVRAENDLTGCWSVMMIELRAIPAPVVPPLDDQARCDADGNPQDGFTNFDLTTQEALILSVQSGTPSDYDVSYHLSQSDAQSGINPIVQDTNYINTSTPRQTIWVRVAGRNGGCANVGSFDLIVTTPLALVTPPQLTVCDDGPTSASPSVVFDLTIRNADILGTSSGYTVTYYPSQADALADTNAITTPEAYTNTSNAQTLGVVVSGPAPTFCKSYTTLTIRVLPLPVPRSADIPVIRACDDNLPAGTETLDLTLNQAYIRDNDPQLGFEYYTTLAAAHAGTGTGPEFIATPTAHEIGSGVVYIRVERTSEADHTGEFCYVIVEQPVLINPLPQLVAHTARGCDASGTGANTYAFDLSDYNVNLLAAGQDPAGFTFSYWPTLADAQGGTNPLPASYTNTANPQDITVKVVNNDTGCVAYTTLTLTVAAGATATDVTAAPVCDTDTDGFMDIDLTQFDAQVLGSQLPADFSVAYYATAQDAELGINAITGLYSMETGNVYAVVTNIATGCPSEPATVGITIEPLADIDIAGLAGTDPSNTICVDYLTGGLIRGLLLESGLPDDGTYTFEWTLGGQIMGTGATYLVDSAGNYGIYTLTATTALGCVSAGTFEVIQSGPAAIPAGTDGYVVSNAFSENQTIVVTVQGYGEYHYQLDNGPILDNGGVFENVPVGEHTVYIYDVKGQGLHCGSVSIGGIFTIDYPKFFTPNGDGFNDTWKIDGLDDSAKIYIFDRYGKLVKQLAPNGEGWDGTYNGSELPSTDYWFTVNYNEANSINVITKEFKAHFSLKR